MLEGLTESDCSSAPGAIVKTPVYQIWFSGLGPKKFSEHEFGPDSNSDYSSPIQNHLSCEYWRDP